MTGESIEEKKCPQCGSNLSPRLGGLWVECPTCGWRESVSDSVEIVGNKVFEKLVDTECCVCGRKLKYPKEKLNVFRSGICRECRRLVSAFKGEPSKTDIDTILRRGRLCLVKCREKECPGWSPKYGCPFYLLARNQVLEEKT